MTPGTCRACGKKLPRVIAPHKRKRLCARPECKRKRKAAR